MAKTAELVTTEPNGILARPQIDASPAALIHQAIVSGANVEVMERLMDLQERWEKNAAKKAFDLAMANVRDDLPAIVKSRTVDFSSAKGHTYYRYEELHDVTEALSPVMSKHGLSFRWRTNSTPDAVTVTCIIAHSGGHFEETSLTAASDRSGGKNDIQALGSAVTYLQRYTLKAALGIAAGNDDDGDTARGNRQSQPAPGQGNQPQEAEKTYANTPKHDALRKLIEEYCGAHKYTPEDAKKILSHATVWDDKDGKHHPGKTQIDQLSEKQATYAPGKVKKLTAKYDELRKLISDYVDSLKENGEPLSKEKKADNRKNLLIRITAREGFEGTSTLTDLDEGQAATAIATFKESIKQAAAQKK